MKINPSNWPTDFDDVKTNFKNEINQAVKNKFKTKIMRSTSYNFVAVGLAHYKQVVTIGIILTQKAVGVNRVYEAIDGN